MFKAKEFQFYYCCLRNDSQFIILSDKKNKGPNRQNYWRNTAAFYRVFDV